MINLAKTSALIAITLAAGASTFLMVSPKSAALANAPQAKAPQTQDESIAGISTADLNKREVRKLKAWLDGRTPGAERQCIRLRFIRRATQMGDDIMLYEMRGGKILVNRTSGQCRHLGGNAIINRSPDDRICQGQIFDVEDLQARIPLGSCSYGKFVEYDKTDSADAAD